MYQSSIEYAETWNGLEGDERGGGKLPGIVTSVQPVWSGGRHGEMEVYAILLQRVRKKA